MCLNSIQRDPLFMKITPFVISVALVALAALIAWKAGQASVPIWHMPALIWLALLSFAIQWVAFLPAYRYQTEHYYDLTGSITYATLIALALFWGVADERSWLLATLVGIWCTRLGVFLFRRIRRDGKDRRFDAIKTDAGKFLMAWTIQGLWVFLTLLAALIAITTESRSPSDLALAIGAIIWAIGFTIEVVADAQKSAFRRDPANRNTFIQTGLWAWSRHPNYFGEILLWLGIAMIALPGSEGWQWLGLISPLFVYVLISRISGVPLLEQRADKTWGGQSAYESYKATTPVLGIRRPQGS